LKPYRKNRLDLFLDGSFQFLNGLEPSRIPNFFVVIQGIVVGKDFWNFH